MSITGPHIQVATPEALAWARVAPCVLGVDNVEVLKAARSDAHKVFRHFFDGDPGGQSLGRSAREAAETAVRQLGGWNDPLLYVQAYNEVYQTRDQELVRYLEWQAVFSDQLFELGYRCAGLGFGVGNPPKLPDFTERDHWDLIKAFNFGLPFWRERGHVLLFHQYFGLFGVNRGVLNEHTSRRHVKVHEWTDGIHPAIIIGETGYDRVDPEDYSGFRLAVAAGRYTEMDYVGDLLKLDYQVSVDAPRYGILGQCVFGAGPVLPQWQRFDVDGLKLKNDFYWTTTTLREWYPPKEEPMDPRDEAALRAHAARYGGIWKPAPDAPEIKEDGPELVAWVNDLAPDGHSWQRVRAFNGAAYIEVIRPN